MTFTLKPCPGCGRACLTQQIANLTVKCDPTPLDGQGVAVELMAGRQLWTPMFGPGLIPDRLKAASPGDAKLLREHACTVKAATAVLAPVQPAGGTGGPARSPKARVAPSRPSSGVSTEASGVPDAVSPHTDHPNCDSCGRPCLPGTYWGFQHGTKWIYAQHGEDCM